jgi:hypothetical protein
VCLASTGSRLTVFQLSWVVSQSCDMNALTTQLNSTQLGKIVKCSEFRKTGQTQLSWVEMSWVVHVHMAKLDPTEQLSWIELSWVLRSESGFSRCCAVGNTSIGARINGPASRRILGQGCVSVWIAGGVGGVEPPQLFAQPPQTRCPGIPRGGQFQPPAVINDAELPVCNR